MLLDSQRCEAYRNALNRIVRPGDVVLDLGAGTGLLSMLAVQAGARHVYAIEMSEIAGVAATLIETNGLGDRITLIPRKSTKARLPERCDLLVTETLSILGFDTENIVDYLQDARRRLLKPDARIIPESCKTLLMPIQSDAFGVGRFPLQLYGVDWAALRQACYSPKPIRLEASGQVWIGLAEPAAGWPLIFKRDFRSPGPAAFDFVITLEGRLDGFLGWFEATLCPGVTLSNSPRLPPTSWSQIYFPILQQPVVHPGQRLTLHIDPGLITGWPHWSYSVRVI